MIRTPQDMSALTNGFVTPVWTFAAVGVLYESGLAAHLREPRTSADLAAAFPRFSATRIERLLGVASAAGVVHAEEGKYRLAEGAMCFSQPPMLASMRGDVRAHLMQALAFLDSATSNEPQIGWRHTDRRLLQAQGDASAGFAGVLKTAVVGMLGDLAARLEAPGARMLDVGVGVGALAIAMCRTYPALRVVGLDTFDVPLAIARENVAAAALGDRIELRHLAADALREESTFDLAWLPSFFVAGPQLPAAAVRVHASLRPGGWVLLPIGTSGGDDRQRSVLALVSDIWGGPALSVPEAEALLKQAGFATVRALPAPPWAPATMAAQR